MIGVMTMIAFYVGFMRNAEVASTMAFQRCVCQDLYMALIVSRINLFGLQKQCGTIKV